MKKPKRSTQRNKCDRLWSEIIRMRIGCVKDDKRIIGFIRQLLTKQKAKWVEEGWQIGYKQCKESK